MITKEFFEKLFSEKELPVGTTVGTSCNSSNTSVSPVTTEVEAISKKVAATTFVKRIIGEYLRDNVTIELDMTFTGTLSVMLVNSNEVIASSEIELYDFLVLAESGLED